MIIIAGHSKGGVGKTALATNIATIAASRGIEVCLIDTDPGGSATVWSHIRNQVNAQPNIPVFSISSDPKHELIKLAQKFDLVVVDIGANSVQTFLNAAKVADLILIPVSTDQLELVNTTHVCMTLRELDAFHKKGKIPFHVVLNSLPTNSKSWEADAAREYLQSDQISVFRSSLKDRSAWRNSRRSGLAVHELSGRERDLKASAEMEAIFEELIEKSQEVK